MKDIKGIDVTVNDHVVYVVNAQRSPALATGVVTSIYTDDKACSVKRDGVPCQTDSHVKAYRIMKIQ